MVLLFMFCRKTYHKTQIPNSNKGLGFGFPKIIYPLICKYDYSKEQHFRIFSKRTDRNVTFASVLFPCLSCSSKTLAFPVTVSSEQKL